MNPKQEFFCGAPTRQQAKDIFWSRLKRETSCIRVDKSETELYVKLLNGSKIYCIGLDRPERIEGRPWHGCHITEMGNLKENAWPENIYPALSDTRGFAYLDGVPEGRNFYYDLALYASGGVIPTTRPILGGFAENQDDPEWCYYHWFSEDVLPMAVIENAKRTLDERTYRQEYQGSFESYAGLAYWPFNETNLRKCEYNKKEVIHIGMDFNVNPMTAACCHIQSDDILQFDEFYLNHSNTFEMAEEIKRKYQVGACIIYPDSTGQAMESNATMSDIAILKKAGFRIKAHPSNPYVKDRINAVNSKIRAGDGKAHYFINPKNCPKTMSDLNKVETTNDGRIDKTQEATGLTHISSALGYLISYLYPIRSHFVKVADR